MWHVKVMFRHNFDFFNFISYCDISKDFNLRLDEMFCCSDPRKYKSVLSFAYVKRTLDESGISKSGYYDKCISTAHNFISAVTHCETVDISVNLVANRAPS